MTKFLALINKKPSWSANANMVGGSLHLRLINMFSVIDVSSLNLTVGHPDDTLAKISPIGNLRLSANIVLFDVLVILEYCVSLLSVHKLIKDS
ncbi:hypothetical protein Tco_0338722 [Tanacetum coccineum]